MNAENEKDKLSFSDIVKAISEQQINDSSYKKPGCFETFLIIYIWITLSSIPYIIVVNFDLTRFDLFDLFFYTWLTFALSGIVYTVYEEKNSKK